MLTNDQLHSSRLILRCLREEDASEDYLQWLADPAVTRYLEVRHNPPASVDQLKAFIGQINESTDTILFGIFLKVDAKHIGNIKLGPMHPIYKRAEIGIVLGDQTEWGKGFATEAIALLADYAEQTLGIRRLAAGCYGSNRGSLKAFLKAGFILEATLEDYWTNDDGTSDSEHILGRVRLASECFEWNPGEVKQICFIGGGQLMFRCMQVALELGFEVGFLQSQRHAKEFLSRGGLASEGLDSKRVRYAVLDSAHEVNPKLVFPNPTNALALCFGPSWIFPEHVMGLFSAGMLNFNGIPLPHYLGGAHYSWQIMNGSTRGGCHVQKITTDIDRGEIVMSRVFDVPLGAVSPDDYFKVNENEGLLLLKDFLVGVHHRRKFTLSPFDGMNSERLYFPRLSSEENSWVDWAWNGNQIARFCNAFSAPYSGARTLYEGQGLRIHKARFVADRGSDNFHPYCSGLIVRKLKDSFAVAVMGGLLAVEEWSWDGEQQRIREGSRLYTERGLIEHASMHRPRYD